MYNFDLPLLLLASVPEECRLWAHDNYICGLGTHLHRNRQLYDNSHYLLVIWNVFRVSGFVHKRKLDDLLCQHFLALNGSLCGHDE